MIKQTGFVLNIYLQYQNTVHIGLWLIDGIYGTFRTKKSGDIAQAISHIISLTHDIYMTNVYDKCIYVDIKPSELPPETTPQVPAVMNGKDLALTCKAAFEAFENSECRRLQIELDRQVECVQQLHSKIDELDQEVLFLNGTCAILTTRFV